jgi:hypothetical protein
MRRAAPFIKVLAPAAAYLGLVACTDGKRTDGGASTTTPTPEETEETTEATAEDTDTGAE